MFLPLLTAGAVGYVLGAIPFGYLVARAHGVNIFEEGSKNPGATNVKRVLGAKFGARGKKAGNMVFALDALKGALASSWSLLSLTGSTLHLDIHELGSAGRVVVTGSAWTHLGVAGLVGALVGHSFSCFTRFKGGKGVATTAGGFLVLAPFVVLSALVVWLAAFFTSRYVSLASILAAVALPIASVVLGQPGVISGVAAAIGAIVIIRHRANIKRLLDGTESRFTKKT